MCVLWHRCGLMCFVHILMVYPILFYLFEWYLPGVCTEALRAIWKQKKLSWPKKTTKKTATLLFSPGISFFFFFFNRWKKDLRNSKEFREIIPANMFLCHKHRRENNFRSDSQNASTDIFSLSRLSGLP